MNVSQDVELHNEWCALGAKDDFQLYPGDHLLTDPTSITGSDEVDRRTVRGQGRAEHLRTCTPARTAASARLTPESGRPDHPDPELAGERAR